MQGDKLLIEILEPIKSLGLVEKLWQRAQPLAENVNNLLKEGENDLSKKYGIHLHIFDSKIIKIQLIFIKSYSQGQITSNFITVVPAKFV